MQVLYLVTETGDVGGIDEGAVLIVDAELIEAEVVGSSFEDGKGDVAEFWLKRCG